MPKKKSEPKKRSGKADAAPRPFFSKGTKELEALLEQGRAESNLELLHALAHELSFRDKPQSIALAERVRAAIDEIENPSPPPPPESPLADVIRWLEQVAARITHDEALALRERLTNRFPDFARFLAEREPKPDQPRPLTPQPRQPGLPFDK